MIGKAPLFTSLISATPSRRALWLAFLVGLGLAASLFVACSGVTEPQFTPTPTRTPRPPTATPTPTSTPTPTPTPTPIWPVTAGCDKSTTKKACDHLRKVVSQDTAHFTWVDNPASPEVQLGGDDLPNARPYGTWVYAAAAPFFTVEDGLSLGDLQAAWRGEPAGPFAEHPLLVTTDTLRALDTLGAPAGDVVQTVSASDLLTKAIQLDGWAILPFDELEPRWKVLRIDDASPLDEDFDRDAYPLTRSFYLGAEERSDALSRLPSEVTNRDPDKMTVLLMTGVTALTRGTAIAMEREGVTYPAQDIRDWLLEADLTHVSNEVSFAENCPPPAGYTTLVFCSDPRYIELLEDTDIDAVELTGNHLLDWGVEAMRNSLRMYEERNMSYYGGGWTLAQARNPLILKHGEHTFGFLGCNPVGPSSVWATDERPGAASCDYDLLFAQIRELRQQDIIPIVTFQYWEFSQYEPTLQQQADFRAAAEAGAVIVSGSQAHQPQGFGFHAGAFIHYGLGNLFFDQMQSLPTRQEFLDRHVFYEGQHISTEVLTAMLEDYARPRPMTPDERQVLLETAFEASSW